MGEETEAEYFGPYVVYERLGVGGMATVHRALERHDDGFERMVALKRLLPHLAEDASFIKSFVREAKLASMLNHVNIVQIFELGRVGTQYFISMEYIEGRDIRQILRHARKTSGPPPIHVTIGLAIQLAEALDYAHTKVDENGEHMRLVHRDVSPSNLLVTTAGHLKVIDFGIAKAESAQLRTQTGRVKGKLAYMAPEAIAGGRELDSRCDLWAVGVVMHELLCARPLFASKNEYQTLLKVQRGDIMPPSTFNQGCPPELDAVVVKALSRDPDRRFARASDLRDALLAVKKRYALQTGYRDIATWVEWAFSLEPAGFSAASSGNTGVSAVGSAPLPPQARIPTPQPARSETNDEDEAVEMVWGSGQHEAQAGPLVLDEVPDVSERHAALRADTEYDDIPTPLPTHGNPLYAHAHDLDAAATDPGLPPRAYDPSLARGTDPPKTRGSSTFRTGPAPVAARTRTPTSPGIAIPRAPTPAPIPRDPDTDPVGRFSADAAVTNPVAKPLSSEELFGNRDEDETLPPFDDSLPTTTSSRDKSPSQPPRLETPPPSSIPAVPVVRFSKGNTVPPVNALSDPMRTPPSTKPGMGAAAARPGLAAEVAAATAGAARTITAQRKKRPSDITVGAGMMKRHEPNKTWIVIAIALAVAAGGAATMYFVMQGGGDEAKPVAPANAAPPAPAPAPAPAPKTTSTVKFVIEPADSEIKIEGQPPHSGSPWMTELPPGIHQVEIHHGGYKAWLTSLELSTGENETLRVVLEATGEKEAETASLIVETVPAGLDAVVDGKPLPQKTPIKITIKPGPHTIAVRQNGADVWRQKLKAEANSDYEFHPNVTLEKQRERAARDSSQPAPKPAAPKGDSVEPEKLEPTPPMKKATPPPTPTPAPAVKKPEPAASDTPPVNAGSGGSAPAEPQ